jgi:hypothetical protein
MQPVTAAGGRSDVDRWPPAKQSGLVFRVATSVTSRATLPGGFAWRGEIFPVMSRDWRPALWRGKRPVYFRGGDTVGHGTGRRHATVCACAVIVLTCGPTGTWAQDDPGVVPPETGREWLARCGTVVAVQAASSRQPLSDNPCLAWIQGLIDMHAIYQGLGALERTPEGFCLPSSATLRDVTDSIVHYLRERPPVLQVSARMLAYMALRRAFPCDGPP